MRFSHFALLVVCSPALAQVPVPEATPGVLPENLTRFEYHRVELRRQNDSWLLMANGQPLKEFGRREADARQALKLIHDLRLTHHGVIGTPQPVIEYWLADGQAPRGIVRGLRLTPLDTASVRAEFVHQQWCVRDSRQVLFQFGSQEQDARTAAAVIQRYEFNQVGYLGQGEPSMMYFVTHHSNKDSDQVVTPRSSAGSAPNRTPAVLPVGATQPGMQGQLSKANTPNGFVPAVQPYAGRQLTVPAVALAAPGKPSTPTTALATRVDRVPFDWRRVELKRDNNDWKLVCGSYTLAHFGHNEREARLALSVLQKYRFTELCLIGKPNPTCSYYLVYGQAPRGLYFGVSHVAFRPEAVTAQEREGTWILSDGQRTLVQFAHEHEAQQALRAIQEHKFDHWCHVGRPGQGGMTFFVRGR